MAINKKMTIGATTAAILAAVFAHEGGYVNNPKDPGGETNHGITLAVAQAAGYTGAMKDLTREDAGYIYVTNYINKPGYAEIIKLSHVVGEKVVDVAVNTGPGRSSLWFQNALNALNRGGKDYAPIKVDGSIGPASITAYSGLQSKRGKVKACELVLKLMDVQQGTHYMGLTNLKDFTVGWVDNRIGNVPVSRCKEEG